LRLGLGILAPEDRNGALVESGRRSPGRGCGPWYRRRHARLPKIKINIFCPCIIFLIYPLHA
jgi:hypothetical protein